VARRPAERAVYSLVVGAAVGVLPGWARRELGLSLAGPLDLVVDTVAVTPLMRGVSTVLRWVVTPPG
jgi:ABC-type amino acid transport system permease subunit